MPLALPNLDDRRWADLVQEAGTLIPLYAAEWTDYNPSDPGITFAELFAWRAEMDLYQLNQVPDAHKRKFLSLAGVVPEPPRAARAVVRFVLKTSVPPVPLPAETEIEGQDLFNAVVRFRILDELTVWSSAVQSLKYSDAQGFHDLTQLWQQGQPMPVFGIDPRPGAAFYVGLDGSLPTGSWVHFYLSFAGEQATESARRRLIEQARHSDDCCRAPDALLSCEKQPAPEPPSPPVTPPHHCARVAWEFHTGANGWQRLDPKSDEILDDTRSLTLNGSVKIKLPTAIVSQKLGFDTQEFFYLRCVFVGGAFDAASQLTDIAVNAVVAEQAIHPDNLQSVPHSTGDLLAEQLGQGSGLPNQVVTTNNSPVLQSSFRLFTIENNVLQAWDRRRDFDGSNGSDRHFLFDPTSGKVRFGNGDHGLAVPEGALVVATYLSTVAADGNLGRDTLQSIATSAWNNNLLNRPGSTDYATPAAIQAGLAWIFNSAATGGGAAETLVHAEGRAVELIGETTRTVTLSDCQSLALQTPGTSIARVAVKANVHPAFPCLKAPGMIAVLIVPFLPAAKPGPSTGLVQAVSQYLRPKRALGTRIEVFGPTYVEVVVQAQAVMVAGWNAAAVSQSIIATLNAFFDPLTGGPDGQGWPFGRDVYRSEVLRCIAETDGVDHVVSLDLLARGGTQPQCGNVCLGPTDLVAAGLHQIEVAS
jgi:hypothetical protein